VSHVFNFEMPNVPEQYVHRIGRTARAGADGISVSFVAPDEKPYLRDIEKLTGIKLMPQSLPENFAKEAARLPAPSRKPAEAEQDARRDARDARGRGGQGRSGQGRGGSGRGNNNVSRGGQGRDGLSRDAHARNDRTQRPQGERGPVFNPLGQEEREARAHRAAPQGEAKAVHNPRPAGDRQKFKARPTGAPQTDRPERRPDRPAGAHRAGPRRQTRDRVI